MIEFAPYYAAAAALCFSVLVLNLIWAPAASIVAGLSTSLQQYNFLEACVVACSGDARPAAASEAWRTGLSNKPHDQLNLTERQYARGLNVFAGLSGLVIGLVMMTMTGGWAALILGAVSAFALRYMYELAIASTMRQNHEEQLRRFPFFLDIFRLHVQAGGDLGDAITSYRTIYGNDPMGRELAILQESYPAFGVADSFDRLRNRVGNVDLKNVIGELAQKLRVGANLELTLAQQSEDMRELREELATRRAEELNAKFNIPVILATVATFLIFLSPAIALISGSGFL